MGSLDLFSSNGKPTSPLSDFNPFNPEEFRKQAHKIVDFIANYYTQIESYPVLSQVEPGFIRNQLPQTAPSGPEPLEAIFKDINSLIIPGMTHWQSPNFFAFFPLNISTAAFLGEMLCTSFNGAGFNWQASPAMTELEMVVMDWLANMIGLPKAFLFSSTGGGVIQNTTSDAILLTLNAARDRVLEKIGTENMLKLVVYGSDQTHSTFEKVSKAVGIHPNNIRLIHTNIEGGFSMCPVKLRNVVENDVARGLVPLYLCGTVGTTSTTTVDPLEPLANVATDYGMWFHVDAAYAGSACICPEFRHCLNGIERVDSLSMNPHKWLLSCLGCCCLWVKRSDLLVKSLSVTPEYLKNECSESKSVVDFKDWQLGTSRRFNSIRLWVVLRSYGVENLQNHIRSDVRMAEEFESFVKADPRFEVVVPRLFALVCFRLNPNPQDDSSYTELLNRNLLDWVNSSGKIFMSHTIVGGIYMLRFAVGATLTEECHVIAAWNFIKEGTDELLKPM
ncbi:tryptophan decarboxylase TDC2-like [Humulus lupulus]|uniref:tryptophan decarboxylase TDC2-like n=1 Tax=Humulus lupulus TaxID=3486 RepID=UPI002B40D69E|nr:tryptophan decarboxylase TDC2-like [Humulus lupulus]